MRLLVTINGHFQAVGGDVFSHHLTYERFWARYLDVFDEVLVVARVRPAQEIPEGWDKATGPGVAFCALPDFHGPWQYLRVQGLIDTILRRASGQAEAYLFRVADQIGTLLWQRLPPGTPYGVEVVSDPWLVFAPGGVRSVTRPFVRRLWAARLRRQCRGAAAAAYVTRDALQRRYPPHPDAFTTHYSSVELDSAQVLTDGSSRINAIRTIPDRLAGRGTAVRLGFVGSFSQRHKLPQVHLHAVARCLRQGANVCLEMIGAGQGLSDMKALAGQLGIADRVLFRGQVSGGGAVLEAMDRFDLFLNATAAEGLPRVVIEAMARGCPCIASDVGGTSELLEQPYRVLHGDAQALALAVLRVLSDPQAMAQEVTRNIRLAEAYTRDVLQARRKALYSALRDRTGKVLSKR